MSRDQERQRYYRRGWNDCMEAITIILQGIIKQDEEVLDWVSSGTNDTEVLVAALRATRTSARKASST